MTVDELMERSDAVYMAIGTQKPMRMDVPGEDLQGVESGLTFLRRVGLHMDYTVPRHLVVIGGGSTAMDVARTALRLGAEDVTVAYRRTMDEMPAGAEEVEEALEEGIRILELAAPVEILGENGAVTGIRLIRRELAGFGKDGRMNSRSIPGSEFDIPCDGVIAAVNQGLDADTLPNESGKGFSADRFTGETERPGMFAGGDAVAHGSRVAINAIADGKIAAAGIDRYLGGSGILNKGEEIDIPVIPVGDVEAHDRFPTRALSVADRVDNFREVAQGYHNLDAMAECLRCLHCDRR